MLTCKLPVGLFSISLEKLVLTLKRCKSRSVDKLRGFFQVIIFASALSVTEANSADQYERSFTCNNSWHCDVMECFFFSKHFFKQCIVGFLLLCLYLFIYKLKGHKASCIITIKKINDYTQCPSAEDEPTLG